MTQLMTEQGMVRVPAGTWKVDPIHSSGTVEGSGEDPWGNERVGISIRGMINRTDFGLTWQKKLESGGLLVGEEVRIVIDVSAVRV